VGFLEEHWAARVEGKLYGQHPFRSQELVLWTFLCCRIPEDQVLVQSLFKAMMDAPLELTYEVALQAMILEELDRVKYQWRIRQCGQFLLDNQLADGSWSYGMALELQKGLPRGARDLVPWTKFDASGQRQKPKVGAKQALVRAREPMAGPGDNSNSAFAALGLRACHDAGITFPRQTIESADKGWRGSIPDNRRIPSEVGARGWGYLGGSFAAGSSPYGSTTADAVASLVIYSWLQDEKKDWKKDPAIGGGVQWLTMHFSATRNPEWAGTGHLRDIAHLSYLWSLERMGAVYGTELLGLRKWHEEGLKALLDLQKPDGSWDSSGQALPVELAWNTAMGILFIKRGTRPLVAK
jgi:hypothetical protein